jgi:catechol 2,3-dioxygenase-like lactoylglutathione lyase family enzyme
MNPRLAVVTLWAEDVTAAAYFYREVVGLRLAIHHAGRPHFDLGEAYLVILQGTPRPAENPIPDRFPLIAFSVEDLQAAVQKLEAHGIEMPWGIEGHEGERYVMFKDPSGNLVELVEKK